MGRIEKTVFISYRRTNFYTALAVYQDLRAHGYDVFFDYRSIDSGNFEQIICENIRHRAHFLIILSPSALERIKEPDAILRREIELAIDEKRNIVPLMMEGFDFDSPSTKEALTGKLEQLKHYSGLRLVPEYFFAGMEKLRNRYLNIALEDVPLAALSAAVKEDTEEKHVEVSKEPAVKEKSLTAEEWFERGFVFQQNKTLEEALRCYHEVIQLEPDQKILAITHSNVGVLLKDLERYDEAESAFRKAIELDPSLAPVYYNLGIVLGNLERYDEAESAFRKAIELDPSDGDAYYNLGNLLKNLERYAEAESAYRKATELDPSHAIAYSNLGILLKKLERYDEAESAYRKAIELNPSYAKAYYNLSIMLGNLERYDEAETAFSKAIELDPSLRR